MKPARVHLVSNRELKSISSVDTEAKSNNLPPLVRKNQVAPAKTASPFARSHSTPNLHFWVGFQSAFGAFGLALVLIVFISISWTTWLIVLAIAPNATANYLMDTSELDDGNFWLIVDPDYKLKIASIIGLAIVDVFYLFILFKLVLWRKTEFYDERSSTMKHHGPAIFIRAYFDRIKASWGNIVGIRGKYRKLWNLTQKVVDLVMQSIMLRQLLRDGSSTLLVMGYSVFLGLNALSVATGILMGTHSALHEILVDSIFDLFAAVLYPILVLLYSANNFYFDQKLFSLNLEFLPPGSFERNARIFADPAEIALFITSLDSLRILSYSDLALRISMNISFCLRFITVINLMVETAATQDTRETTWKTLSQSFHQQRRVSRWVAVVFVAFGAAVVIFTHKSISDSEAACAPYPETVVDVFRAPRTFQDWTQPVDVSDKVEVLSRAGMLQNLQLLNRALTRWPEELRKCDDLQYISLIYTETESLPDWAKLWKNLQVLHIEGKQLRPSLSYLPEELFSNMPFLQVLHLGVHPTLPRVPPLNGVPSLQSLTLAGLYLVTEIPSFEKVPKLQRLMLPQMDSLQTIPDMAPLKNLASFMIMSICPACCNGFIGHCDPTDWFCVGNPDIGVAASTCLAGNTSQPTSATASMLQRFAPTVCIRSGFDLSKTVELLSRAQVEICGGVPYRRCEYPRNSGKIGMCINNRLQVLMCMVNDDYIRLRKAQIQRKIGPVCDPTEEAWLGCGNEH